MKVFSHERNIFTLNIPNGQIYIIKTEFHNPEKSIRDLTEMGLEISENLKSNIVYYIKNNIYDCYGYFK